MDLMLCRFACVFLMVHPGTVTPWSIFGRGDSNLRPVIIVPGKGGNQIEGHIDGRFRFKQDMTGYQCPEYNTWFRLWLDVWKLLPSHQLCFSEVIELDYDPELRQSRNKVGVTTRIPGFGDTKTIEYVDPSWAAYVLGDSGKYIEPLVTELLGMGYERGKNLRGAPYDFRLLPHSQADYFVNLKWLIEKTYYGNNRERVVIIAHSMGGKFTTYFLQTMEQSWKDKYVHAFVPVNTPWTGTAMILPLIVSGYDFEDTTDTINAVIMRKHQRSFETVFYLLPSENSWSAEEVLVSTAEKNYTVSNLAELFERINHTESETIMADIKDFDESSEFPGVNTMCWYSTTEEMKTPEAAIYGETEFPDVTPTIRYGDGDGTVNLRSLTYCQDAWADRKDNGTFSITKFSGADHVGIFENQEFLEEFKKLVRVTE